jgi:hypothetical protein
MAGYICTEAGNFQCRGGVAKRTGWSEPLLSLRGCGLVMTVVDHGRDAADDRPVIDEDFDAPPEMRTISRDLKGDVVFECPAMDILPRVVAEAEGGRAVLNRCMDCFEQS